jgi:hypothetical protein
VGAPDGFELRIDLLLKPPNSEVTSEQLSQIEGWTQGRIRL